MGLWSEKEEEEEEEMIKVAKSKQNKYYSQKKISHIREDSRPKTKSSIRSRELISTAGMCKIAAARGHRFGAGRNEEVVGPVFKGSGSGSSICIAEK